MSPRWEDTGLETERVREGEGAIVFELLIKHALNLNFGESINFSFSLNKFQLGLFT